MKKFKSIYLWLSCLVVCTALSVSCVKQPGDAVGPVDNEGGNGFDYSTTSDIQFDVDYCIKGNKALFEVYDQNPVISDNGVIRKKDDVNALYKLYTDNQSRFSGKINLPIAVSKVYLYSEAYGLPALVEADVTPNGISFNLKEYVERLRPAENAPSPTTRAYSAENPYNIRFLGSWNNNGDPDYVVGEWHTSSYGKIFVPTYVDPLPDGLYNRIQTVLLPGDDNSKYAKPTEQVNVQITKDSHLTLVFLSEMAALRNAIGYYYYDTQNPPRTEAQFEKLPKYLAFPNCSSFTGDYVGAVGKYMPPLWPGEQIDLVYYNQKGDPSKVFPKGTTIGWFMLPDAYRVSSSGDGKLNYTNPPHGIRYSNNEFNENNTRYFVSLYDQPSTKTVIGFEDSSDKGGDYKDVLIYLESDPVGAIVVPDTPTTNPSEQYPDVTGYPIEGTLVFEDLWPSQGDYDMNDIVIRYSTTFTTDKDNKIILVHDVFTPLHSGGQLKSAFGYQLDVPAADIKSVTVENGSSTAYTVNGLEAKQNKPTVMLFDDLARAIAQGPITVKIELNGNTSLKDVTRKSLYNPFVCISSDGFYPGRIRKEIHLTNYAPTAIADPYFFGRNDDKSTVDKAGNPVGPYYYVASDLYPFALDMPTKDYHIPSEMISIDTFYPDFSGWVKSKGEKNKEWYLKPIK